MAGKVNPDQVRGIREAFGLNASQFAAVLGVHPTTVSRWENASGPVEVDGMAWTVLTGLAKRIAEGKRAHAEAARHGQAIAEALVVAGAIAALALLVAFAARRG